MEDYRNFLTQLLQRGISRKNRFRVTIPLPPGIFDSNATLAMMGTRILHLHSAIYSNKAPVL